MILDSVGGMFPEQGKTIHQGDVLLVVSFFQYANEVLKLAGNTQERRILVIVITDCIFSPLVVFSDLFLEVKETEVFDFRGVILSSLMSLSLSLVVELGRQIEQQKKEMK